MNTQRSNALGPFLVLTFVFFIIGLMTTINGQCQGPMKIAFLEQAGELKNTLATLILACDKSKDFFGESNNDTTRKSQEAIGSLRRVVRFE